MVQRVLIGQFPDGGYGVRISQAGYDVTTNPVDNERLVFNSDWSYSLPLLISGTISVPSTTVTVNFGLTLPYVPFCSAFVLSGGDLSAYYTSNCLDTSMANMDDYVTEGAGAGNIDIGTFNNQIVLRSTTSITVKYFVYRLKAFS